MAEIVEICANAGRMAPIYLIWAVAKISYQPAGAARTRISDLGKIAEIYQN